MDLPALIPIAEAGQHLGGISRSKIYQLVDDGKLCRAHVGRSAFITGKSVSLLLERIVDQAHNTDQRGSGQTTAVSLQRLAG